MIDFFWRCYMRAMTQSPPKFITRMEEYETGPVKMPSFWVVMGITVVILFVAWVVTL